MKSFSYMCGKRLIRRTSQFNSRRVTATLLSLCMVVSVLGNLAISVPAEELGPCPHHKTHTEACGFQEAADGCECSHLHDASCGHVDAREGIPCNMGCGETDEAGNVIHVEGCAYTPATEEVPCGHVHDEACGYAPAVEGSPCRFVCPVCSGAGDLPEVITPDGSMEEQQEPLRVTDWQWADEEGFLTWNEEVACWGLGLPGASEDQPVTGEVLESMLPTGILVTVGEGTLPLELTWDLSALPAEGAWSGSYILTAALPEGYALEEGAFALSVLLELGGGEGYAVYPAIALNEWVWESCGAGRTYVMEVCIDDVSTKEEFIAKIEKNLPKRIYGLTTGEKMSPDGPYAPDKYDTERKGTWAYLAVDWQGWEKQIPENWRDGKYTIEAKKPTYEAVAYYINAGYGTDSCETMVLTIHPFSMFDHIVQGINPPDTTINLFDYWVDTDGAKGNDILLKSDTHADANGTQVKRTTPDDWNKGINVGRLFLFGDGNIHAGFWNKGAGAGGEYGKNRAGMMGIVERKLTNGYPVIDTSTNGMNGKIEGYEGISDWELCGDHTAEYGNSHNSADPKNISNTVQNNWRTAGNSSSLDYLFDPDPDVQHDNKRSYTGVGGLFQIDNNGYYYYNMRKNFAEYDEGSNSFILYDAPAVDRTDGLYDPTGNGAWTNQRSIGNFLPFNKGTEVFDAIDPETGKLTNSEAIQSDNTGTLVANHHLGMTLQVDFRQPEGGMINMGAKGNQPMSFQFSGDDDVWVFVDDVLVLDLGGIHSEIYGTIDFSTGKVMVGQSWKTNGFPYNADGTVDVDKLQKAAILETTLYEQFAAAKMENDVTWATDANGNKTFRSNSNHTLKMFFLERGNYDSSLAVRFNLQPQIYQSIKKVDQNGQPIEGITFELYPAEKVNAKEEGAISCFYTDGSSDINGAEFFVRQKAGAQPMATLTTGEDGVANFLLPDSKDVPFNFADQDTQYFVLKEVNTPDGYRALPIDLVLYFDRNTTMLSVANRWSTGAYAASVSNIIGAGQLTYGKFDVASGEIGKDDSKPVSPVVQEHGLVLAIPMLWQKEQNVWEALSGSNMEGFQASKIYTDNDRDAAARWRNAVLRAALRQAQGALDSPATTPGWYLDWDSEDRRLEGMLNDLPGLASRYRINNPDGDMRMIYAMITPDALRSLEISQVTTPAERYAALGRYVKEHGVENTLNAIMAVTDATTGSGRGFSFLNVDQFNRNFRSRVYIPNEQRELWVMKVDQNGVPRNGATFGLFTAPECSGQPVARGTTASVNGQDGLLIFSPRDDNTPGHARIVWASKSHTHYYLKELSAPSGYTLNGTVVPVVVGTYSIYADAGKPDDGVSVMAGVGKLTQTMVQHASEGDVDITLRDIKAIGQYQPSDEAHKNVQPGDWKDMELKTTLSGNPVLRSMALHYKKNAMVDYGLHDEDGGANYRPFFITDEGYIRARVEQNYPALTDNGKYGEATATNTNKDDLGSTNLTSLFSLLNVVVVTDHSATPDSTGKLTVGKIVTGTDVLEDDFTRAFEFTITFTDPYNVPLAETFYFNGTDKSGQVKSGDTLKLHHDESITILGLPAGTRYTVTETRETGWGVETTEEALTKNGIIQAGQVAEATFMNVKGGEEPGPTPTPIPTAVPTPTPPPTHTPFPRPTPDPPEESPVVTPSATPSVSPSPDPSESPEVTPSVSPSVPPEESPVVSPGESPAVSPSAVPSADPSESPAPGVSQSPTPTPRPTLPPELPDPNDPESPEEVTIWENDVPKTYIKVWDPEEEEYVWLLDEDTPLGGWDIPQTGDVFRAGIWSALFLLSGGGLLWLSISPRRKRGKREDRPRTFRR